MYCESCGSFIQDGDAFCSACGAPVPKDIPAAASEPVAAQSPNPEQQSDLSGYTHTTMEIGPDLKDYAPPEKASTLSAVGLGFGMVAIMFCWVPFLNFAMAATTLVMAIIVLAKKLKGKKNAIASIVCASISIIVGILELMLLFR